MDFTKLHSNRGPLFNFHTEPGDVNKNLYNSKNKCIVFIVMEMLCKELDGTYKGKMRTTTNFASSLFSPQLDLL